MPALSNPLVLNPDDEFDAILIDLKRMHAKKAKQYGTESDPHDNFYDGAIRLHTTPLDVCLTYATKHESALRKWLDGDRLHETAASNDAVIDRTVYAILFMILYRRGAYK
jgi:hypothetical protein